MSPRFHPRDPLTTRVARTLRETRRDGMDWWEAAEAAAADEDHIRAMFSERRRPPRPLIAGLLDALLRLLRRRA